MAQIDQDYDNSLDWLYSFIDFSMKRHVDDAHRFFKLDRMNKLMALLGNPEKTFPCVHVAGTKGKGSTASFIASALQSSNYKVGLYTSPHLQEFTERIQVNHQQIPKKAVVGLTEKLRTVASQVPEVTTFELTTAMGFLYFAKQKVDIAVLEVGLGGRLDATNIIDPLVSVITPVSYDHRSVLGNTLTEIAFEKGGIIKPGRPVILAPQHAEAEVELRRIADQRHAPLTEVDEVFTYAEVSHTFRTQKLSVIRKEKTPLSNANMKLILTIPLLGFHQIQNAVTALAALEVLRQQGFHLTRDSIRRGFRQIEWPARFEILRLKPPFVIDSAHNGDSMQVLRQTLDEYFPQTPFLFIFGASADKEIDAMLDAILPRVQSVITTQSTHPRAASPEELQKHVLSYGVPCLAISPAEAALTKALELAGSEMGIIVSGSIFIASAALAIWPTLIH